VAAAVAVRLAELPLVAAWPVVSPLVTPVPLVLATPALAAPRP
jgi:hypothetical protein